MGAPIEISAISHSLRLYQCGGACALGQNRRSERGHGEGYLGCCCRCCLYSVLDLCVCCRSCMVYSVSQSKGCRPCTTIVALGCIDLAREAVLGEDSQEGVPKRVI